MDRELVPRVAHLVDKPIGGCDADAEEFWVGVGQFWNVGGDIPFREWGVLRVERIQECLDRGQALVVNAFHEVWGICCAAI